MTVLDEAFELMLLEFGPQHWWPGDSSFEIAVGAVLTQNTAWKNVERALVHLREADVLSVAAMHAVPQEELAELIRPAGYYRLKARRLKNFVSLVVEQFGGSMNELFQLPTERLRETLLTVNGIGPETADSIVLYGAQRPVFVIDAYTARVLKRHAWIDFEAGYAEMQQLFHSQLAEDVERFNEYHALIVRIGKDYCRSRPRCEGCPLQPLLPEAGPQDPP